MTDLAAMAEQAAFLTAVNKWVGVVVALIGLVIISIDGAGRFFLKIGTVVAKPFRRLFARNQTIQVSGIGSAEAFGGGTATASGLAWNKDAPVQDQVQRLLNYVLDLEKRHNQLTNALSTEKAEREQAIAALSSELTAKIDDLHALIKERDQEATRIDARGFPVVGLGIILTGIPEYIAEWWTVFQWGMPFGSLILASLILGASLQDRRIRRS